MTKTSSQIRTQLINLTTLRGAAPAQELPVQLRPLTLGELQHSGGFDGDDDLPPDGSNPDEPFAWLSETEFTNFVDMLASSDTSFWDDPNITPEQYDAFIFEYYFGDLSTALDPAMEAAYLEYYEGDYMLDVIGSNGQ